MTALQLQGILRTSPIRGLSTVRGMSTRMTPRFIPTRILDNVEDPENYHSGGLHPISIGNCFAHDRYRILHKLGDGGSWTVWLARDQGGMNPGKLVALKALRADVSNKTTTELTIHEFLKAANSLVSGVQTVDQHFFVEGPNGSHLFLVSTLAGPSIEMMSFSPGRAWGSKRLRSSLARKVAKQVVMAVDGMHRAGVVHGDINARNILFCLKPDIHTWTDTDVNIILRKPNTETVETRDGTPLPLGVPERIVETVDNSPLMSPTFLEEKVILIDFGQSYIANSPPAGYEPAALLHYFPPEARFDGCAGFEADVWSLGCTIFQIRTGVPLFHSFYGSRTEVIGNTVAMLGKLPDSWWEQFEKRSLWFTENGEPKSIQEQESAGVFPFEKTSIRDELRYINTLKTRDEGPMFEKPGVGISENEVELLGDLLEKMLRYRPEDRIGLREVINHPWMAL